METLKGETENQKSKTHVPTEMEGRIKRLNERLARYIPPREIWTPGEGGLFKPIDLYRVPADEARQMQLRAVMHVFARHYKLNHFYRKLCETRGVAREDIRTYDDLEKIPLIPDIVFKQHPSGVGFAHWIANIYTGELPTVVLESDSPTFDEVINAFHEAGIVVTYSSGTSGRHTVIPRDMRTYMTQQFATAKLRTCLFDSMAVDHYLELWPKPAQTNLAIGKAMAYKPEMYDDLQYALDFEISADMTIKAMTDNEQERATPSAGDRQEKIIEKTMKWLELYEKTTDSIGLSGGPFLILELMDTLEREGKHFEFGERGTVGTGGGWKISEDKRISATDFRRRVEEVLGIPETRCLDVYAMCEMNGIMITCPEGHYFHTPSTWLKPLVLDRSLVPAGYDESGRFAFLDGLAGSYPGFIITGDEVRMYEHCPVCDRPGPVLDPEVKRAPSVEMRGCAEEVRRVLTQDFEG
ncbi:MAG: LuxE/PaaK family acyltransferase [Halobacteriota archaeon]